MEEFLTPTFKLSTVYRIILRISSENGWQKDKKIKSL